MKPERAESESDAGTDSDILSVVAAHRHGGATLVGRLSQQLRADKHYPLRGMVSPKPREDPVVAWEVAGIRKESRAHVMGSRVLRSSNRSVAAALCARAHPSPLTERVLGATGGLPFRGLCNTTHATRQGAALAHQPPRNSYWELS